MATDYDLMMRNLLVFYPFAGKKTIAVGAGGRLAVAYARPSRQVVVVERDAVALAQLRQAALENGVEDRFTYVASDFADLAVPLTGDVVLFDFCLHEMADVPKALKRAFAMAPEIVVFDHGPDSEWAYYVLEEDKVARMWGALDSLYPLRCKRHATEQTFSDRSELIAKVKSQGPQAERRCEHFESDGVITIPMTYQLALLVR